MVYVHGDDTLASRWRTLALDASSELQQQRRMLVQQASWMRQQAK